MISIPSTAYLLAGTFLAGTASGGYAVHTWYKAQKVEKLQEARQLERGGVRTANQSDVRYIDRLHENTEKANARASQWQTSFNLAADSLRKCSVSPDIVRLLNSVGAGVVAGPASGAKPAAKETETNSNCAVVLETYKWNIENVVRPNEIQIEELQKFYREIQQKFNK